MFQEEKAEYQSILLSLLTKWQFLREIATFFCELQL